ncbi:uncharacterized protein LOC110036648, partial [Phalaenopsis equestris]|uniref:uncharacterized protein LOC110036648 n=1 Tax=Phalaenopsis equestris TaxID=78828 RepID=UPI0009E5566A
RQPPPSPIATGKGLRSAALHDEVLSEYLETTIKVPHLALPHAFFSSRSFSPNQITVEIDLSDLASGDAAAVRSMVAAAAETGGFRINGGDVVRCEEVNAVVEAGAVVFSSMAAKRRGLVSRFGIGEEICWYQWKRKETEMVLEDVSPDTYRIFRERMEVMAAKLEMVADCISCILCELVQDKTHSHRQPKLQSVLCLKKHSFHLLNDIAIEHSHGRDDKTHFLRMHIPILDHQMFQNQSSGLSASFGLPAGSILVTIGDQLKEWSNGEYRNPVGGVFIKPRAFPDPLFSMEFIMYSPADSGPDQFQNKIISLRDQFLVLLLAVFFFKLWFCSWIF